MVSGNLDGVGELVGNFGRERQDKVPIERRCDPGEGVDPVLRPAAFLKARNDGLGCFHPLSKLALAQPGFGAHVVDELAKVEVLFDRRPRFGGGLALGFLDVFPSGVVGGILAFDPSEANRSITTSVRSHTAAELVEPFDDFIVCLNLSHAAMIDHLIGADVAQVRMGAMREYRVYSVFQTASIGWGLLGRLSIFVLFTRHDVVGGSRRP